MQDPRIKFFEENGVYVQARAARLAREGRTPIDWSQFPRLATALPESKAAIDAKLQEQNAEQAQGKYSLYHAAASGRFMLQPPGSPWRTPKEKLVNPK